MLTIEMLKLNYGLYKLQWSVEQRSLRLELHV
jgi:hypothetical protein